MFAVALVVVGAIVACFCRLSSADNIILYHNKRSLSRGIMRIHSLTTISLSPDNLTPVAAIAVCGIK